ncbi:MAG TPA: hypothetical protein VGJ60_07165 [Chloroflexota bacterium]|jgi:hypothetical protein
MTLRPYLLIAPLLLASTLAACTPAPRIERIATKLVAVPLFRTEADFRAGWPRVLTDGPFQSPPSQTWIEGTASIQPLEPEQLARTGQCKDLPLHVRVGADGALGVPPPATQEPSVLRTQRAMDPKLIAYRGDEGWISVCDLEGRMRTSGPNATA